MSNILPALADRAVPIDSVAPWPGNPRKGNLDVIAESLSVNGQYRPITVQKSTGHIVAGNQTWHAARTLGWDTIAVEYLDVDDNRARHIVAIDNRASDLAVYDDSLLAELLSTLDDLAGSGFTPDDLDDLLASLAGAPVILDEVPATDATYAETPEDEAARAQRIAEQTPRYAQGLAEVILVYPQDARVVVLENLAALRERMGPDTSSGTAVAAALSAALHTLDGDHAGATATLTGGP